MARTKFGQLKVGSGGSTMGGGGIGGGGGRRSGSVRIKRVTTTKSSTPKSSSRSKNIVRFERIISPSRPILNREGPPTTKSTARRKVRATKNAKSSSGSNVITTRKSVRRKAKSVKRKTSKKR